MKSKIKKLLSVLLLMTMLIATCTMSLANTGSGTGATKDNAKGDSNISNRDPNCPSIYRPAWLVYIQRVDSNIHEGTEFDYAKATSALGILSECKDSAVNTMLTQYPNDFANEDNDLANKSFVVVNKGPAALNLDNITIAFSGDRITGTVKAYDCGKNADSSFKCTLARDDILGTTANIDYFMSGKLTLDQLKAYMNAPFDSRGQTIEDAQKSFASLFADIGSFESKINSTYAEQQAAFGD